jgi:phosphate transport system substrate-binding protein
MKSTFKAILAVMTVALFSTATNVNAGQLESFKGEKGTLRIAGGTAHIPVMKEAAKRIMTMNPEIKITIAGGGSGVGIKQVGEGLVDIGNSGRKPTDEEIARYDLKMFQWALDGVGAICHPSNPVKNLSKESLQKIFSGKLKNWKELGGPDRGINLYTRDEASGTREVFHKRALNKQPVAPWANVVVSNGAMKSAMSNDPYGIGYVSVGHIDNTVSALALDGIAPTSENVKNGKYPVSRGLFSNTRKDPQGLAKHFLNYLFTPEGQKIVADNGFIPVK